MDTCCHRIAQGLFPTPILLAHGWPRDGGTARPAGHTLPRCCSTLLSLVCGCPGSGGLQLQGRRRVGWGRRYCVCFPRICWHLPLCRRSRSRRTASESQIGWQGQNRGEPAGDPGSAQRFLTTFPTQAGVRKPSPTPPTLRHHGAAETLPSGYNRQAWP